MNAASLSSPRHVSFSCCLSTFIFFFFYCSDQHSDWSLYRSHIPVPHRLVCVHARIIWFPIELSRRVSSNFRNLFFSDFNRTEVLTPLVNVLTACSNHSNFIMDFVIGMISIKFSWTVIVSVLTKKDIVIVHECHVDRVGLDTDCWRRRGWQPPRWCQSYTPP